MGNPVSVAGGVSVRGVGSPVGRASADMGRSGREESRKKRPSRPRRRPFFGDRGPAKKRAIVARGVRFWRQAAAPYSTVAWTGLPEELTVHSLRQGFCTLLAEKGKSAFVIKGCTRDPGL